MQRIAAIRTPYVVREALPNLQAEACTWAFHEI
jgi:hypothetical protein